MTDPMEFNIGCAYDLREYVSEYHSDDRKANCALAHFNAALDYYCEVVHDGDVPNVGDAAKELLRYYDELLKAIHQRDDDRALLPAIVNNRW